MQAEQLAEAHMEWQYPQTLPDCMTETVRRRENSTDRHPICSGQRPSEIEVSEPSLMSSLIRLAPTQYIFVVPTPLTLKGFIRATITGLKGR